jgi:hypothetical protein
VTPLKRVGVDPAFISKYLEFNNRVARVDDDRPVAAALSDMTSHFLRLLLSKLRKIFQRTLPPGDHISGSHPGGGIECSKEIITSLTACVARSSRFEGNFEGSDTDGR